MSSDDLLFMLRCRLILLLNIFERQAVPCWKIQRWEVRENLFSNIFDCSLGKFNENYYKRHSPSYYSILN